MKDKLINFIRREFEIEDDFNLDENSELIESGLIDSLSLYSLIVFIEKEFNIKLSYDKISLKDFENVRSIEKKIKSFEE